MNTALTGIELQKFNDEVMFTFCLSQMKTHAEAGLPTSAAFYRAAAITTYWAEQGFEWVEVSRTMNTPCGRDYVLQAVQFGA